MARFRAGVVLIAVVSLLPQGAARADESPTAEHAKRAREVRKKLAAPIDFSGIDDPDTKLAEALEFLHRITNLNFDVNEQAFKDEMIDDVGSKPLGRAIPPMKNVPPEKVLRRILDRVPTSSGTTFVVRGGTVEITTRYNASPSNWRHADENTPDSEGGAKIFVPQTSVAFERRPLRDAVQEIADATGVNIVVDIRAEEKAKAPVSATVQNADVDTVVNLLADMAGLESVLVNDVFYVATKENAKALREKALMKTAAALPGGGGMLGASGAFGLPGGGFGGFPGLGGGGGIMGGVPQPRLPAPKEQAKPAPPAGAPKPTGRAPSRTPTVAADNRPALPPLSDARRELWAREASRSPVGARRTRRRVLPPEPV